MPHISQRGISMPASPIRKLVPLADRAKAKGIKVYHLNIGQPDLPTPEVAMEALKHVDRKVLEYSPSEGILSFRQKLVKYYAKFNIIVDVDDIIITTGGVGGGAVFLYGLSRPGRRNYCSRTGLRQLYGLCYFQRRSDQNYPVDHRGRLRAAQP